MKTILVIVGSLRKGSINLRLAKALEKLAADRLPFVYADLHSLPIYNDDLWETPPTAVTDFKQAITAADAVLIVTPEYNRSTTPVILNAIAWGSRPSGKNSWNGKLGAIVGASPGAVGTAVAQSHVRSIVTSLGFYIMAQPEVYFQMKPDLIGEDLSIADEKTEAFLKGWVEKFGGFLDRFEDV
jgi:chromate reductase, NAD(P)H dehydrogenase (quinone)